MTRYLKVKIGLDITENANVPRALCLDCVTSADDGEAIYAGDGWGGDCKCERCGCNLDVIDPNLDQR